MAGVQILGISAKRVILEVVKSSSGNWAPIKCLKPEGMGRRWKWEDCTVN